MVTKSTDTKEIESAICIPFGQNVVSKSKREINILIQSDVSRELSVPSCDRWCAEQTC